MKNPFRKRKFWGVLICIPNEEPSLLGSEWHPENKRGHQGCPTRCLLFYNRQSARNFCKEKNQKYSNSETSLKYWRLKPVRITEMIIADE